MQLVAARYVLDFGYVIKGTQKVREGPTALCTPQLLPETIIMYTSKNDVLCNCTLVCVCVSACLLQIHLPKLHDVLRNSVWDDPYGSF